VCEQAAEQAKDVGFVLLEHVAELITLPAAEAYMDARRQQIAEVAGLLWHVPQC
jgi:hypothetical protein